MTSINITVGGRVSDTDAFALITEGWNDMVQEGLTPERTAAPPFASEDDVLYASYNDGEIVGVIVFRKDQSDTIKVTLAYVEPSSRRKGVFRSLINHLLDSESARRQRACRVSLLVYGTNTVGLDILAKLKAEPISHLYGYAGS